MRWSFLLVLSVNDLFGERLLLSPESEEIYIQEGEKVKRIFGEILKNKSILPLIGFAIRKTPLYEIIGQPEKWARKHQ